MYRMYLLICLAALAAVSKTQDYENNESVKLFRQYIQIDTTTYSDLTPAVEFWEKQAESEGVEFKKYEYIDGFPVVVLKWPGTNSSLGSVMLNSHMDVVPADESDGWTYPPFSAYLDEDGVIWGRGTQDMKSVGIQYFEALKRLKAKNETFLRDIYMTLMPDEEIGSEHGMRLFLDSAEFAEMNVGVEMDEGTSYNLPLMPIFYQDKVVWQIQIECYGVAGHGSTFPATNTTATGKCYDVMGSLFEFRDEEHEKSLSAGITNAGTYTSINLNILRGGTANNVIPDYVSLVFDIRLGTTLNLEQFDAKLRELITAAGDNITLTYLEQDDQSPATRIDSSNPYWTAISGAFKEMGLTVLPIIPPGSTDARFVREHGIPAFGFSPMPNTELLLHSVNERLAASTFLSGIDIYENLIPALANVPAYATSADASVYVYKTAE